jgi:hypothetical protein
LLQKNLKIFGIGKSKSLADYVTNEKDVQRGNNRMPMNLARQPGEDLMKSHHQANEDGIFNPDDIGTNIDMRNEDMKRRKSSVRGQRGGIGDA